MKTIELFSIPVMQYTYKDHKNLKYKIADIISKSDYKLNPYSDKIKHYFEDSSFLDDSFLDFENFLKHSCLHYVQEILGYECDELIITDCWINVCDVGGFQTKHDHANAFVSGTYYLNMNSQHSQLNFYSLLETSTNPFIKLDSKKPTSYNQKKHTIFNKEGVLALWPSNIPHGYETNMYPDRISISMNFMPKKLKYKTYSFSLN